jgi:agmatine deiminase
MSTHMPAEWAPHARTWMEFPPLNETFAPDLERYRTAWTNVANTVARYEPVTVIASPGDRAAAARLLVPDVDVVEQPIDDAWLRDSGPTFTITDGRLTAVHWRFNAWGNAGFSEFAHERLIGGWAARRAGVAAAGVIASALVNEGGGFHVDGQGAVLLTDTVQLDPRRNPGWSRQQVETEVHARLGTERAVWLPRGLSRDYERFGTSGHVDIVACFVEAGTVLVHVQPDPRHPDHAVTEELIGLLRRHFEVIEIAAPTVLEDPQGWVDYSYVNHYVCNGAVILCAFDDRRDDEAAAILADLYPGRQVELVDARPLFECGGGIHCITQQQPVVSRPV